MVISLKLIQNFIGKNGDVMKNKSKKITLWIIVVLLLVVIFTIGYFVFFSSDKNKLTLEENKWIDSNSHNVIDIAIMNDIPVLSYDGKGLVYDYLDYVTQKESLKFNVIPYKLDNTIDYEYKMDIVSSISKDDIVLLEDNLVLFTNNNLEYTNLNNISNLKLGVLSSDKELISNYFIQNGISSIELIDYATYTELKQALMQAMTKDSVPVISGIIIPKAVITEEMVENDYKIAFQFVDLTKYFVLKTTGVKELNSILYKTYTDWKKDNYKSSYNKNLLEDYYNFKNITDIEQKKLHSKSYMYGFIEYGIYNNLKKETLFGLNEIVLKEFKDFSNLSITYTKYNSINKLMEEFNSKKIDFVLDIANSTSYNKKTYSSVGVFDKNLVIVTGIANPIVINSIQSLKNKEVLTIKDSYLEEYLVSNQIKVKSYNNVKDLVSDFTVSDIILLDLENYNYYKSSSLKDSKISYVLDINEKYNYVLNDTEENNIFKGLFDFYLNYTFINKLVNKNYDKIAYKNVNVVYVLAIILLSLGVYVILDFSNHLKHMFKSIKKNKKTHMKKEDKIKYIDQLTSLKNRAYLNNKIETWDESEVYPQSIIVIDLNNISYINDNYGREEGDKVITEAANILIQHQMQNSEIIRTDGNEFLIYLVGYNEKQIISYLRKLNKEFKGLSHGFGAASGYSIINDAIKTIDDAVNEATLDMKNNKEDIDY